MISDWIDTLAEVCEISVDGFRTVRSYRLVSRAEFPSSLDPAKDFPAALTIPAGLQPQYSYGGPLVGLWTGVTEFHVTPNLDRTHLPALLRWYGRIWEAFAANMDLGGKVEYCIIPDEPDAITGPIQLAYGNESPHWGFVVRWIVKEHVSITVS